MKKPDIIFLVSINCWIFSCYASAFREDDYVEEKDPSQEYHFPAIVIGPREQQQQIQQLQQPEQLQKLQSIEKLTQGIQKEIKSYAGRFYTGPTYTRGEIFGRDIWASGARMGVDYAFSQVGVGVLTQYNHTSGTGFLFDEVDFDLYFSYVPGGTSAFALSADIGYVHEWYYFHTSKGFTTDLLHTAKGTPNGNGLSALFNLEYTFDDYVFEGMPEELQISPIASVEYIQNHVQKFQEKGAQFFDLQFQDTTFDSLRASLQLFLSYMKQWNHFSFSPRINVGWQREFLAKAHNLHYRLADTDGPSLKQKIPGLGRNYVIAGVDLLFYFYERYGIETSWNYEWNKALRDSQFYLGLNWLF